MQFSIVPPISNSPFLLNSIIPSNSSLSCQYKPEESPLKHVNSISSSNLGELAFRPLEHPALDQFDWPTTLNFSATKTQKKQEKEPKKGPNLERVRLWLFVLPTFLPGGLCSITRPAQHVFEEPGVGYVPPQHGSSRQHKGEKVPQFLFCNQLYLQPHRFEGLDQYMKIVNLLKLTAHIRFVYVRFHILKMTKHPEDGTIRSDADGHFRLWPHFLKGSLENCGSWDGEDAGEVLPWQNVVEGKYGQVGKKFHLLCSYLPIS